MQTRETLEHKNLRLRGSNQFWVDEVIYGGFALSSYGKRSMEMYVLGYYRCNRYPLV